MRIALLIAITMASSIVAAAGETATESIPPLPIPHYSAPLSERWLKERPPEAIEACRLMGSVSISASEATRQTVVDAVALAQAASDAGGQRVVIALNYSPWHYEFRKWGMPESEKEPVTLRGVKHYQELARLTEKLWRIRAWLAETKSDVRVAAILYDCEVFDVTGDAANDVAVREKLDASFDAAREAFPDARIYWFGFGAYVPGDWDKTAFAETKDFPWDAKTDAAAVAMYYPGEPWANREVMRRTAADALNHGVMNVVAWVSLGAGYVPVADPASRDRREWTFDYEYPTAFSWYLGRDLNRSDRWWRPATVPKPEAVVFYPAPSDERVPCAWDHFVAYCSGAANLDLVRYGAPPYPRTMPRRSVDLAASQEPESVQPSDQGGSVGERAIALTVQTGGHETSTARNRPRVNPLWLTTPVTIIHPRLVRY